MEPSRPIYEMLETPPQKKRSVFEHPILINIVAPGILALVAAYAVEFVKDFRRPPLVGEVQSAEYWWPPGVLDYLPPLSVTNRDYLPPSPSADLYAAVFSYKMISSVYVVTVLNRGDSKLSGVTLNLPEGTLIFTGVKDGDPEIIETNHRVVTLGELRPGQRARVFGWGARVITERDVAESITLAYDNGRGQLVVKSPAGPFARLIEDNATTVVVMTGVALIGATVFPRLMRRFRRRVKAAT